MNIFNGNEYAKELESIIVDKLSSHKPKGKLGIIQIGNDSSSAKYINLKIKLCHKLDIPAELIQLDARDSDINLISAVSHVCNSNEFSSVIIQLPLPRESLHNLLELIPEAKDVDCLSKNTSEKFYNGDFSLLSPVVRSIKFFTDKTNFKIPGSQVIVIGEGNLVGKPAAHYMKIRGAHVNILNETHDVSNLTLSADLIISAAGVPNLLKGGNIEPGAHVIDFGSSVIDGKLVGDLDLRSDTSHLGNLSPSPGGMGPLVVRFLVMNHLHISL